MVIEAPFNGQLRLSFQQSFTLAPFNGRLHWLLSTFVSTGSFQCSFTLAPFNGQLYRLLSTVI